MSTELQKAKDAVNRLINLAGYKEVGVVIYRNHKDTPTVNCYPTNYQFTSNMFAISNFLGEVKPEGGGGYEATLDGLAQAKVFNWSTSSSHIVIHISDIISCENWPNWKEHNGFWNFYYRYNCCCCSGKCSYKWDKDVFEEFRNKRLKYHLLFTGASDSSRYNKEYAKKMMEELGPDLCI